MLCNAAQPSYPTSKIRNTSNFSLFDFLGCRSEKASTIRGNFYSVPITGFPRFSSLHLLYCSVGFLASGKHQAAGSRTRLWSKLLLEFVISFELQNWELGILLTSFWNEGIVNPSGKFFMQGQTKNQKTSIYIQRPRLSLHSGYLCNSLK